jgi:hypothetical protein
MVATILWNALYALLIFWTLQAVYVLWRIYRNDAMGSGFRRFRKPRLDG